MSLSISSIASAIPARPSTASTAVEVCERRRRSSSKRGGGFSPKPEQRLLAPPSPELQVQQQQPLQQNHRKRNSFHGFCLPNQDSVLPHQSSSTCCCNTSPSSVCARHSLSMLNRANGQSLLQLPNRCQQNGGLRSGRSSGSVSPAPSEEELLLPPYHCGMIKPKYSLNLRPEDCGQPGTPPRSQQQQGPTAKGAHRVSALAQANRQQGSTDSAPTSAGISSKKRKEIWAQAGPCSFHQSFDIRCSDPLSLSNSCGHIVDVDSPSAPATGAGFRTERRSGFCSGDTSRDSRSHPGHALTLFCGTPGCSGHAPCPGVVAAAQRHQQHPMRSTHSSFDEGDQSQGHLRDTYLTEISREWMIMNGAITPFKNILQQASSISNTPLANHRPIQQQSPAGPAAAAAVSTASAIMGNGRSKGGGGADEEQLLIGPASGGLGPYATGQAIRGSLNNLAAVTAAATTSPSVFEHLNSKGRAGDSAGAEPIIIIEPRPKEGLFLPCSYAGLGFVDEAGN